MCTLCRWASSRGKWLTIQMPHPKCLGSQKNPGAEPKTCEKGPKLGFEYLPTSKTSHCVRTACMAFPMRPLCTLYAPSMRPLCALYAPTMRPLCAQYAPSMRPLCAHYAPSMRPLCAFYAPTMRPLCTLHAPSMRPLCVLYVPSMAKCLHCVRTACILCTQRLGYSPKNTCHLFTRGKTERCQYHRVG